MHDQLFHKQKTKIKRAMRVRKRLRGSEAKPRLSVYKSNHHIYAQIINDESGKTLVALGTTNQTLKGTPFSSKSKAAAREVGKRLAELAKSKEIQAVVFDRGPFKYHGLVAELAEGARAAGLQF